MKALFFALAILASFPVDAQITPSPQWFVDIHREAKAKTQWTKDCVACDEPELAMYMICARKFFANAEDMLIPKLCNPKRRPSSPLNWDDVTQPDADEIAKKDRKQYRQELHEACLRAHDHLPKYHMLKECESTNIMR